jgi:Domain of unknown function (DUF4266)
MKHSCLLCGLMVLGVALTAGCVHVNPWERGALADPIMNPDRDTLGVAMTEHMWFSREAASGGRGVGGGGCGCN